MSRYWKAWGGLIGAAVGVAAVHGVVPDTLVTQVPLVFETLVPIATTVLGTIISPKNSD